MFDWLKDIAAGFEQIFDFIKNVIDFITDFINDVIYVVKVTGEAIAKIPEYFSWLPSAALSIVVLIFSVVVIYKVLGREG